MTRHTFATSSPTRGRLICQCEECQGRRAVRLCPFTRELFEPEEMIPETVAASAPASLAQRSLDLED